MPAIVMLMLIVSVGAFAQEISPKRLVAIEKNVNEMAKVMGLSEQKKDEVLQLKKIVEVKYQEVNKKFEKGTEEYKQARKAVSKNYNVALKKYCSKEQIAKWKAHQKAKQKKKNSLS